MSENFGKGTLIHFDELPLNSILNIQINCILFEYDEYASKK